MGGEKETRLDIGTINRFDDSRIRNFLLKHASGLDFLATLTQREQVVRDEEVQSGTGTTKIDGFPPHGTPRAMDRHTARDHAVTFSRARARVTYCTPPQVHRSIDRLSSTGCLKHKGPSRQGNGGAEVWRASKKGRPIDLVLYSISLRSSESFVSQRLQFIFLRYDDPSPFSTIMIPIGEQPGPVLHALTQCASAIPTSSVMYLMGDTRHESLPIFSDVFASKGQGRIPILERAPTLPCQ